MWFGFVWVGAHSSDGLGVGLVAALGLGFVFDGCGCLLKGFGLRVVLGGGVMVLVCLGFGGNLGFPDCGWWVGCGGGWGSICGCVYLVVFGCVWCLVFAVLVFRLPALR